MKRILAASIAVMSVFLLAGVAGAGGKPDGATCHVHKSCQSKLCLRQQPTDKFGKCCDQQDCAEQNKQCGEIDNGCGIPIQCGDCDPGSNCVNNQCVAGTTTTTTTSTTSSTTTTTSSTTTTAGPPGTCDTNAACTVEIPCGGGCDSWVNADASGCFCGAGDSECNLHSACGTGDSCPSGFTCVNNCCGKVCWENCGSGTTTTTTSTTSTTSTTLPEPPKSCAGYCGQFRTVPPGSGPDCYCDDLACSFNNDDGCADFATACTLNTICVD